MTWTRKYICHWCHEPFERPFSDQKHYFCTTRCKQAYHRARKKYVTRNPPARARAGGFRVTKK